MPTIPNPLSLTEISTGSAIRAEPLRDNFLSIQSEFNRVVTILAGGQTGQFLKKDAAASADWDETADPMPTGGIVPFGGSSPPTGYLLCDGSAVSRATYSALFAVIGTTFGAGDGSTTFNLPDLRGRAAVGVGSHADVDALGDNEGVSVASRTPRHTHQFTFSNNATRADGIAGVAMAQTVTSGSGTPSYITINYIIKT